MKTAILFALLISNQAFAVTADECFQALKTFDQHSKTIQVKVSAGEGQVGIVYIVPAKAQTSMQDRSAVTQLRRICLLAGVRRSFHSRPDNPSQPVTACVGVNCDPFEGQLSQVITVTEFLSRGGLK